MCKVLILSVKFKNKLDKDKKILYNIKVLLKVKVVK